MNVPRLSLVLGIAALALGAVAVVSPGLVPVSPTRPVATLVGVLALFQSVRVIRGRLRGSLDEAETPDPERPLATPQPGEDIESEFTQFLLDASQSRSRRARDALTAAAIAVLTQFEGLTESDAKEQVDAGTWTDDIYAAAFLAEEGFRGLPFRLQVRNAFRGDSLTQRSIRNTVDAIVSVVEKHVPSNDADNREHSASESTDSDREVSTMETDTFDENTDEITVRDRHSTGHWRGVSVVALVGIGVGVIVEQPAVLLGSIVGVGYAAYARSQALPPGQVTVDRTLDTEMPENGEAVTVTVTVTNSSNRVLPDIRVVDGVPEALSVDTGSPRHGVALLPGENSEFSYTITARRGVHEFGPTQVIERDLTGGAEEKRLYQSETTLTCIPSLDAVTEPVPLRREATRFVGHERTPTTGDGVEFSATREYRPGDPMARIDWNRHARTRELTTIEFREERAATVVLLIDARTPAYVSPEPEGPHAVDRSVDAAGQLFVQLSDVGNRVGIAATGSDSCWLAPDAGVEHRLAARELLAVDPALSPVRKDGPILFWSWRSKLYQRFERGTQVIYLSPLVDERAVLIARQFDEHGYPVTVIAPDPTTDGSPGHRLAGVARQLRVSTLREAGIPVVDWRWTDSLDAVLARHNERGRQP